MANEINRELKNYYGEISKVLICSGREKREIINSIKESVSCYLNEHPEADIDEIRSIFGTSKEVAEEYLNNETAESIRTKIKRGNAVILIVSIAVTIALIVFIAAICFELLESSSISHGYTKEYITEISQSNSITSN